MSLLSLNSAKGAIDIKLMFPELRKHKSKWLTAVQKQYILCILGGR